MSLNILKFVGVQFILKKYTYLSSYFLYTQPMEQINS